MTCNVAALTAALILFTVDILFCFAGRRATDNLISMQIKYLNAKDKK